MKKLEDMVTRADELINFGGEVLSTAEDNGHGYSWVDGRKFREFHSASLSFLLQVFGRSHPYYHEFEHNAKGRSPSDTSAGLGVLQAAKNEIAGGWLFTIKSLVSAEIFADFIDMAEYLLSEGYKDAAAVMIGSVLEEHLRQLCKKHNIPVKRERGDKVVEIKADTLNADLAKADVYNKLEMKNVLAWLDLRNKAAHGKYDDYDKKQVELMLQGVMDFISRVSI